MSQRTSNQENGLLTKDEMNPPGCICRYKHKSDPMCPYDSSVSSNQATEPLAILRRIAERGLREAQNTAPTMVDSWQHMLDEITRNNTELAHETSSDLKAEIATIEGWNDKETAEWAQMTYERDLLVHRVIAECEALRLGVGISYAYRDDPVIQLKRRMPSVEQITVAQMAVIQHLASSSEKPSEKPVNCQEAGPGRGFCDMCAQGLYEQCRYLPQKATGGSV